MKDLDLEKQLQANQFEQAKIELIKKHMEVDKKREISQAANIEYMRMEQDFIRKFGVELYFNEITPALRKLKDSPPEDTF